LFDCFILSLIGFFHSRHDGIYFAKDSNGNHDIATLVIISVSFFVTIIGLLYCLFKFFNKTNNSKNKIYYTTIIGLTTLAIISFISYIVIISILFF
jgi:heme/copper-type cytochrome/quinol oxidase subunit 2